MSITVGAKNASLTLEGALPAELAKIFVVCDQNDSAPTWGYLLHQRRLIVIHENSYEERLDRRSAEIPGSAFRVACSSPVEKAEKVRNYSS